MRDDVITSEGGLSATARAKLARLLGEMIPASDEYDVPGADDALIVADVVATAAALLPALGAALDAADDRSGLLDAMSRAQPELLGALIGVLAQCYYRDDRVMRSLGMEARPPYPDGFEIEDGDWSLLDPVRAREPFYRRV